MKIKTIMTGMISIVVVGGLTYNFIHHHDFKLSRHEKEKLIKKSQRI